MLNCYPRQSKEWVQSNGGRTHHQTYRGNRPLRPREVARSDMIAKLLKLAHARRDRAEDVPTAHCNRLVARCRGGSARVTKEERTYMESNIMRLKQPSTPEPPDDGYFGICPRCHGTAPCLTVRGGHYKV